MTAFRSSTMRRLSRALAFAALAAAVPIAAAAQSTNESLVQLEVTDSVGLPLPDATLELFAYMPGGVWREWVAVQPHQIEPGMHLLRFSHVGYRASTFSVPVEKGRRVSVRVRLNPGGDSATTASRSIEAREVRAIGLVLTGNASLDFIGARRVIDRAAIEATGHTRLAEVLRRTNRSGVMVSSGVGGRSIVRVSGRALCRGAVVVDGKANRITSFEGYDQLYASSEPEAIEIVERGNAIPFSFRRGEVGDCAVLLVWLRGR